MLTTVLRRLGLAIPTLLGVSIVIFLLLSILPGDPLAGLLDETATPAARDALAEELGFNDPLPVQYGNWLGDVVLSLAALRDLRRNFENARIEVLVRPALGALYSAVAEVNGVLHPTGLRADVRTLRGAFDAAVLLPNSFGTALPPFLAGIPERWGYATDGRGPLLTRRARVPAGVRGHSEVYYYRAMLAGVGLRVSASPNVSLSCPEGWAARGAALLGEEGDWIGINAGAAFGSAKRWLPERFAAAADGVARDHGLRVAIVGGASERPLGEAIAALVRAPARNLCGETTLDAAAAFYQARAGMTPAAARAEAVKNAMFPGGALMYLMGTDAIHALRAEMRRRLGSAFDLRRFHDAFLAHGSIPVSLVAEEMTRPHAEAHADAE